MDALKYRLEKLQQLTPRQLEVLHLLCEGRSLEDVARLLVVELPTVNYHLGKIYEKLELEGLPRGGARQRELGKFCLTLDLVAAQQGSMAITVAADDALDAGSVPSQRALVAVQEDFDGAGSWASPLVPRWGRILVLARAWALLALVAAIGGVVSLLGVIYFGGGLPGRFALAPTVLPIATLAPPPPNVPPTVLPTRSPVISLPTFIPTSDIVCGETRRVSAPAAARFLRTQGVTNFTVTAEGGVLNDSVRSVTINPRGLWIGYFNTTQNLNAGVGHFNKATWADCNMPGDQNTKRVNALAIDKLGRVWAALERGGVAMLEDQRWTIFTTRDGLPSDKTYAVLVDDLNTVWVGTEEGVAKFDGRWSVPFSMQNNTLFHPSVHALAFDNDGDIWVGHITSGVSEYSNADGKWIYHTKERGGIGGDELRSIVVRKSDNSVWFATNDGGVSRYRNGQWAVFREQDGLPSNHAVSLAIDKYNRIWVATSAGVAYYDDVRWQTYHTMYAFSIAFGPDCQNCPYDTEHVWTATLGNGLTHSRLPYPTEAMDVADVKFRDVATGTYIPWTGSVLEPQLTVAPGQKFHVEITVRPRAPYTLTQTRGDQLVNFEEDTAKRFGAFTHITVKDTIVSGQPFTFADYNNPIVAPALATGESEHTYTSQWRVWMFTRYVGAWIRIRFTVRKP